MNPKSTTSPFHPSRKSEVDDQAKRCCSPRTIYRATKHGRSHGTTLTRTGIPHKGDPTSTRTTSARSRRRRTRVGTLRTPAGPYPSRLRLPARSQRSLKWCRSRMTSISCSRTNRPRSCSRSPTGNMPSSRPGTRTRPRNTCPS